MNIATLFKKQPKYYIGIDLGGTNIVAAVIDENGKIYEETSREGYVKIAVSVEIRLRIK